MAYTPNPAIYDAICQTCLGAFDGRRGEPIALLEQCWNAADFPMHCPEHHFLVPAVLLTACRVQSGDSRTQLEADLKIALERARNVPGGFCGLYGACGAAVGAGIFLSVLQDVSPSSRDGWDHANRLTSVALGKIADLGGPRCCKRVCYTAVLAAADYLRVNFALELPPAPEILCTRHEQNHECIGLRCPFYGTQEVRVPRFVQKSCCDGQLDLTYKRVLIAWSAEEGAQLLRGAELCTGEVEKMTFSLTAPCSGTLQRCVPDHTECAYRDLLCKIIR